MAAEGKVLLYAPLGVVGGITSWTEAVLGSSLVEQYDFRLLNYAKHWQSISDTRLHWRTLYEACARFARLAFMLSTSRFEAFYGVTVIGWGFVRDVMLAWFATRFGVRSILHIRSGNWGWFSGRSPIILRVVAWFARDVKFVMLTRNIPDGMEWLFVNPPAYLPNFISSEKWRMAQSSIFCERHPIHSVPTVAYVGWLSVSKGTLDLLRVAELVQVKFVLQGPSLEGDLREFKAFVRERGFEERVTFLPASNFEELTKTYAAATVFALLSHSEGFPNVVLEAMAHGCPVLATDVGAVADMLGVETEAPAGTVTPVGDVQTAAMNLLKLLEDDRRRIAYSRNAIDRCRLLYSEDRFIDLFKQLVSN